MDLSKKIEIHADSSRVWKTITDIDSIKTWNPCVVSDVPINSSATPGEGFKSRLTLIEHGKSNTYDREITGYEVGQRLDLVLKGGNLGNSPMSISHVLNPRGNLTELTQIVRWRPSSFFLKLLSPIITKVSAKKVEQDLFAIKAFSEKLG